MSIKGIYYVLVFTSDLERSKKFYQETLGWKLGTDEHGVAGFSFGDGYLVLHRDDRPVGSRTYGGGMHVEVKVEDAHAEHNRLKGLGVAVSEPRDEFWGERHFSFVDPDGYRWDYGQEIAPTAAK